VNASTFAALRRDESAVASLGFSLHKVTADKTARQDGATRNAEFNRKSLAAQKSVTRSQPMIGIKSHKEFWSSISDLVPIIGSV
jgi:hypothetical protein